MSGHYTSLFYHVIFSTRGRQPWLTKEIREELYPYLGGILVRHRCVLLAIGGIEDHVHLLGSFSPSHSISEILQKLKGSSSHWLNRTFSWREPFAWQKGYSAFSVSASQVETVRSYVLRQEEHHRRMTSEEEWERMRRKHDEVGGGVVAAPELTGAGGGVTNPEPATFFDGKLPELQ